MTSQRFVAFLGLFVVPEEGKNQRNIEMKTQKTIQQIEHRSFKRKANGRKKVTKMHLDWKSFSRNIAKCVILAKNKKTSIWNWYV